MRYGKDTAIENNSEVYDYFKKKLNKHLNPGIALIKKLGIRVTGDQIIDMAPEDPSDKNM